jgi:phosphoketolase
MFAFEPWSIKSDASHKSSKLSESELDTMMHTVRACTFLQAGMQQLVNNLSDIGGMKQATLRGTLLLV